MKIEIDYFLTDIFKSEAKAIIQDILVSTPLIQYIDKINIEINNKIIEYIKDIFIEYYKLNYLNIEIYNHKTTLYGYSFSFIDTKLNSLYLHKIFVYKEYRGNGVGTQILNNLSKNNSNITLVCSSKRKNFYIKNNFIDKGAFVLPDNQNFKMSKMLYKGLYVMCNNQKQNNAPIFLLDDTDIHNIANILNNI